MRDDAGKALRKAEEKGWIANGANPYVKQGFLIQHGTLFANSEKVQSIFDKDVDVLIEEHSMKDSSSEDFSASETVWLGKALFGFAYIFIYLIIFDNEPRLSYFLIPRSIGSRFLLLTGAYLFLLHAIKARPELIEASCVVLLFISKAAQSSSVR